MAITQIQKSGENAIIVPDKISAPHTEIQNRAQLNDINLKVMMGISRIQFNTIRKLTKEFGPNGEEVFEVQNKDDRIRFVGAWDNRFGGISSPGTAPVCLSTDWVNPENYVEITFYGTGLNVLCSNETSTNLGQIDLNGVQISDIDMGDKAGIIFAQGYKENIVTPVTNGLTAGWHTIKIYGKVGNVHNAMFFGCEILNETSDLSIPKGGKVIANGFTYNLTPSATTLSYNSGFETGTLGTTGGKVVVGADLADGEIKHYLTPTDVAGPKYLTAADHTNEEIVRIINWREFGIRHGQDFSTLSTTNDDRNFTMNDGSTTLICNEGSTETTSTTYFRLSANAGYITITFVGTGLGIVRRDQTDHAGPGVIDVFVNGTDVGSVEAEGQVKKRFEDIVSGLPFGTNVIEIHATSLVGFNFGLEDFIVYGPKKPTLPDSVVELGDYNIMADFVANTVQHERNIATGTIRKGNLREFRYVGTWTLTGTTDLNTPGGRDLYTNTNTDYMEYTYWGQGFEYRFYGDSGVAANQRVTFDGSSDLSSYTTSFYGAGVGWDTDATTGIIDCLTTGSQRGNGFELSGVTLGWHTIKIEKSSGTKMYMGILDIITPIYTMNTQNGSATVRDRRKFTNVKADPNGAKALAVIHQDDSLIRGANNISDAIDAALGYTFLFFEKPFTDSESIVVSGTSNDARNLGVSQDPFYKNSFQVYSTVASTGAAEDTHRLKVSVHGQLENEENEDEE